MNIYIALTPYHLILSLASSSLRRGDAIIFIDQFAQLKKYSRLEKLEEALGVLVIYVPGIGKSIWARCLALNPVFSKFWFSMRRSIAKLCDREAVKTIYVFNDSCPEAQFVLRAIKANTVVYIEDGSAAYNNHCLKVRSWHKVSDRLLYGMGFKRVDRIGGSDYVDSALYTYPE